MSLYGEYIFERLGKSICESDYGFAIHFDVEHPVLGTVVYIEDIYVVERHRRSHAAAGMADRIAADAVARGIKVMLGSVSARAKGSTDSLRVLLGYGMVLDHVGQDGLIYFTKRLEA
mgnify:CR=1 FL=1